MEEGAMARKRCHLRSLKSSSLPSDVRDGVAKLSKQLSTGPEWTEAEDAEERLMKVKQKASEAPELATYGAVSAWMESHKRYPRRGRVGEEGGMARKW